MIAGIGVDIVEIARVEDTLARVGDAFARRVLTPSEFEQWQAHCARSAFLAKRWAAKEAFFKAAGTGMRGDLTWQGVSLEHNALGAPHFSFSTIVQNWLDERKITQWHVSLSDERAHAIAFVTLETSD